MVNLLNTVNKFTNLLLIILISLSCSSNNNTIEIKTGPIMGTTYILKAVSGNQKILEQAYNQIDLVDKLMSHYKDTSDIGKFNKAKKDSVIPISKYTAKVISTAIEIHKKSQGAFDISVGNYVNHWGFGPEKEHTKIPPKIEKRKLFNILAKPWRLIKLDENVKIDLSGIAKGFALDLAAQSFEKNNIHNYFIDIGGEIKVKGYKNPKNKNDSWTIIIELPVENKREMAKVIHPYNISLATSGNYRNFYNSNGKKYHHTIDPKTGNPAHNSLGSITVAHQDCMFADAWATALNVLGPKKGLIIAKQNNLDTLFILEKGKDSFEYVYTGKFHKL